ncbi:MAG: HlyD family efflux transporter periplasmic adaptor subunit, partial [Planctomycetota bacterium]
RVFALGRLEPRSGVIDISGLPGERLKALDGDVVAGELAPANGLLGVLASYDLRRAQLDALLEKRRLTERQQRVEQLAADANLRAAEAAVSQADAERRGVALQKSKLANLEEAAAIAVEDFQKLEQLAADDPEMVTPHELRRQKNRVDLAETESLIAAEQYKAAVLTADAAREAAAAKLAAAQANRDRLSEVNRLTAIDQEIGIAKKTLIESMLWAPDADTAAIDMLTANWAAGDAPGRFTVLRVLTEPGELIGQLPVLQLGDLSEVRCLAEVYEADAAGVRPGQRVRVTSPAFDGGLAPGVRGEVVRVAGVVSTPAMAARNPLAPVDRSVVEVTIRLLPESPESLEQLRRRIGLQVTAEFDLTPPDAAADGAAPDPSPAGPSPADPSSADEAP